MAVIAVIVFVINWVGVFTNFYYGLWYIGIWNILGMIPFAFMLFLANKVFMYDNTIVNRTGMAIGYKIILYGRLAINLLSLLIVIITFEEYVNDPNMIKYWEKNAEKQIVKDNKNSKNDLRKFQMFLAWIK